MTERRRRILDAALRLALRLGPRATTMEAVAREAQVAKPTLYGYFRDKEAVFEGVAATVVAEMARAVDQAFDTGADTPARVGSALAAKHRATARLLGASPHAGALRDFGHLLAPLARFEQDLEARIAAELADAGIARPRQLAQLVIAAADGVGRRATSPAEIGPAVRLVAERLLRPELDAARD